MKKSRLGRNRVGVCKIICSVENEVKLRLHRRAVERGFENDSAFLRQIVNEATWDQALTPEDFETLKQMIIKQEQ